MPINREDVLQQVKDLEEKAIALLDERDTLAAESEELRTARREAEEKSWAAEEKIKSLTEEIEEVKKKNEDLTSELKTTSDEFETYKTDASSLTGEKDEKIQAIIKERDELRAEMDDITSKLERVSDLYRDASAEKEKLAEKVDVSDLLAIYILLIENIFGGKPHARVLYTLHNTKSAITRKHIASSTGIMPTAVIKAIHDLRNADLVSYDEETQEVKLTKDIM
ncbi:MAG: hypothetical protein ACTSU3_07175 [Candidatus Thorarchaeota archaeon]